MVQSKNRTAQPDSTDHRTVVRGRSGAGLSMALLVTLVLVILCASPARGSEGAWSHYVQGTYGDFGFGLAPSPGFSFRNDLIINNSVTGKSIFGGRGYAKVSQNSMTDLMKFFYFFNLPAISGSIGFGVLVPAVPSANADGRLKAGPLSKAGSGTGNGFADIAVLPFILNMKRENFHISFLPAIFLPTGYYNSNRLVSLGRNYTSLDLNLGFTWIDPKLKIEGSFNAGYMINSNNSAVSYRTGDELHIDYIVAHHPWERFGYGLTGYVYQQVTGDTGKGAILGPNKSSALGYGPAAMYTPKLFGKDVSFIAKWLHDTTTANRFKGETVFLSVAFSL